MARSRSFNPLLLFFLGLLLLVLGLEQMLPVFVPRVTVHENGSLRCVLARDRDWAFAIFSAGICFLAALRFSFAARKGRRVWGWFLLTVGLIQVLLALGPLGWDGFGQIYPPPVFARPPQWWETWRATRRLVLDPLIALRLFLHLPMVAMGLYVLWPGRRHPAGCCPKCGYDLTGNTSGVCSECGHPVAGAEQAQQEIGSRESFTSRPDPTSGAPVSRCRSLIGVAAGVALVACLCAGWSALAWHRSFAPPGDYDLAWTLFWMGPLPAEEDGSIEAFIVYQNLGKDDIPEATFRCVWSIDGEVCWGLGKNNVPFRSQQTDRFHPGRSNLLPGTYRYRFVLDPENRVQETNEANNMAEGTFTVLPKGHPDVGKDVPADSLNKQLATRPGLFNQ